MTASKPVPKFVGTALIRILWIVLAAAFVANIMISGNSNSSDYKKVTDVLKIAFGLLTFVLFIFSFRNIFLLWTRFGEILNNVVIFLMFSFFYLFIFPFFTSFHFFSTIFNSAKSKSQSSFWKRKPPTPLDSAFFKRMG